MSYCSCGGSHSGQSSELQAMLSARMLMNLFSMFVWLKDAQSQWVRSKTEINGKPCMMELDTPADFSIVSKSI